MTGKSTSVINKLPYSIDHTEVVNILSDWDNRTNYLDVFKEYSQLNDVQIAYMLDLDVKTFRTYKSEKKPLSERLKEQTISLLSLFKHGMMVFGTSDNFQNWLKSKNFIFDGAAPEKNLQTISGIKFIDDRLTAMEHGDNI